VASWDIRIKWADGLATEVFAGRNRPIAERQRRWIRRMDNKAKKLYSNHVGIVRLTLLKSKV
jgi:hypothetical protein